MTSKKTGLKRDTIDKFYTCPKVAKECIQHITYHVSINSDIDIVVEPSAGNGSFISEIKQICQNTQFYDIEPEHELVVKQDYLLLNISEIEFPDLHTKIHVIGNPPFGRQSSLAIQFIKKSALFADSISFILPKSFKKDSMQKHFPPRFHLIFQSEIAPNSFLQDDNCVNVPCVFQIWQKMCKERGNCIMTKDECAKMCGGMAKCGAETKDCCKADGKEMKACCKGEGNEKKACCKK